MSNTYLQLIYMYEHLNLSIRPKKKQTILSKKEDFTQFCFNKKNPIIFTLLFNSNKENEKSTQSSV